MATGVVLPPSISLWQLIRHVVYVIMHSNLHLLSLGVINMHANIDAFLMLLWSVELLFQIHHSVDIDPVLELFYPDVIF